MRRTCLLICFALTLSAQDINNRNNPPMAVAARATTVDIEPGDAKPGLLLDIKNVSSQDIRSYMIVISFTDPVTGKPMGRQRHSVNTNHSDGPRWRREFSGPNQNQSFCPIASMERCRLIRAMSITSSLRMAPRGVVPPHKLLSGQ